MSKHPLLGLLAFVLAASPAHAQSTKAQLNADIVATFPDNNSGQITPAGLRSVAAGIVNSIMPNAPVTNGNLACFSGATGLLQDCGVPSTGTSGYALMPNGSGATYTGFQQPVAGSVVRTWNSKDSEAVSIVDFGAVGNGNVAQAAVNATALNNALATGKCVFIPYTSAGYNFGTNQITLSPGMCIKGENYVTLFSQATNALFRLIGSVYGFPPVGGKEKSITSVVVDMNGAPPGSTAFRVGLQTDNVTNTYLTDIMCKNAYGCVRDETAAGNNTVSMFFMKNIQAVMTKGTQFYFARSQGFLSFTDVTVDYTQNSVAPSYDAILINNFAGVYLIRVTVQGYGNLGMFPPANAGIYGLNMTGNGGDPFGGNAAVYIQDVFVDTTPGSGIFLSNIQFLFCHDLKANQNFVNQIQLVGILSGQCTNLAGTGASGIPSAVASSIGVQFLNSTGFNVSNLWASNNTGPGVIFTGTSSNLNVLNFFGGNNTGADVQFAGTAGNNRVNGGTASSTTKVTNGSSGTGNVVINLTGYNPVGITGSTSTGASASIIRAGLSPETHYIYQTASFNAQVSLNSSVLVCTVASGLVPCVVNLGPNEFYSVAWTATQPTYIKSVH